jgi:hypothetical protein
MLYMSNKQFFVIDIEKMLNAAHLYAELGNRAKPNIHDITRSLENVGAQLDTFETYLKTKVNDSATCESLIELLLLVGLIVLFL